MSDKWKTVTSSPTNTSALIGAFTGYSTGEKNHRVENTETGERRTVTCRDEDVGREIEAGNFKDE